MLVNFMLLVPSIAHIAMTDVIKRLRDSAYECDVSLDFRNRHSPTICLLFHETGVPSVAEVAVM